MSKNRSKNKRVWLAVGTIAAYAATGSGAKSALLFASLSAGAHHIPDYGLPWYFGSPAPVPRHDYYGFADGNFFRANVDMGTVKVEHDLGTHGLLRDQVRYANYQRKWQITEPQVNNKSAGAITPETPLARVMVNRNELTGQSIETSFWDQADLTLTGKLLGVRHTAVVGAEGGKETSDPTRYMYTNAAGLNTVPLTGLLDPDPYEPFAGTRSLRSQTHTTRIALERMRSTQWSWGTRGS